ncbi:unnamed protein product [Bursaphelenchus okinawaensis]|uniref:EB domain-containing protein n=1 Tax=Bursaphelenchus okinawaensis TaxID=465554 RepID=A0A811KQV5_9BILA|nr:unnamed protein product [Bursaphelenchus okinawaensis]CAG9108283.1 unnamed protein product [Bursaphelenchus okinawaensis]
MATTITIGLEANKKTPTQNRRSRAVAMENGDQDTKMWHKVVALLLAISSLISASPAVVMDEGKQLVRRQVFGAPLYSPCGPSVGCAAPGFCQSSMCMPVAAAPLPPPAYAPPMPAPIPVAAPAYAPPPPPPACAPACAAPAACLGGACACPGAAVYSPAIGCAPAYAPPPPPLPAPAIPVPALAPPPPPAPAGRLIPQALPGAPCEPGVECTGGSVCSMGICLCPPELVQEGTVCVARTLYGPVAPAPPPPPPAAYPVPVRPAFVDPCGGIHKRSAEGVDCHN